ncbi:MAG: hypothetical protein CMJ83_10160 [Planctomycetes bacterium]|nr:hypothetical protein [Planctomycetota bacterium]
MDVALVGWGLLTWRRHRHPLVRKLNALMISLFVITPLLGEGLLRVSFLLEGSPTRDPNLYASYFSEDAHWLLRLRWSTDGAKLRASDRVHPLLGWSQSVISEDNPWGFARRTRKQMTDDGRRKILFYGDSFVAGRSKPENGIPRIMDREIASADVVHLGVGGYGTGQIHLLFRETHRLVENPFIIIGVMTYDLDRAVLGVRTCQKPRFGVDDDGALAVSGLPVGTDQQAFADTAPLGIRSYLWRLLVTPLRGGDPRRTEKQRVNAKIIEENVALTRKNGLSLLYVVFYSELALTGAPDWREQLLKAELARHGVSFLDTRPLLLDHVRSRGGALSDLYSDGHHNDLGNQVIAGALTAKLRALGYR